jgi:cell division protein FtsA
VVEIVEQVFTEIKAYGHEDPVKNNWDCTYWWGQLKHIKQLVEYITGMDTRNYPKRAFSR